VVHEIRHARNRSRRERQRLDQVGLGMRRWRDGRPVVDVEVVGEADVDAARRGAGECVADDRADGVGEVDVVDRDLERVLRTSDEVGERVRGVLGRLAAVGECADVYRAVFAARCAALYSRLAA
jgi:hypothetical protein